MFFCESLQKEAPHLLQNPLKRSVFAFYSSTAENHLTFDPSVIILLIPWNFTKNF